MTVRFGGADQLARLESNLLKASLQVGQTIARTVEKELVPLPEMVRDSALKILPRKGGLNRLVADRVVPNQRRQTNSVLVFATGRQGLKGLRFIDRGKVRHPVHGNREKWVTQTVPKRFWTRPVGLREDEIKKAVKAALDALTKEI
jgi:hypothetical protein